MFLDGSTYLAFIVGSNDGENHEIISTTNFKQAQMTQHWEVTIEPGKKTDVWIGIKMNKVEGPPRKEVDFAMDNVLVCDIGR